MLYSNKNKGFTLIELLVVILIIAILMTLGLHSITQIREKGKEAQTLANLKLINDSLNRFYVDHGGYPYRVRHYGGSFLTNQNRNLTANLTLPTNNLTTMYIEQGTGSEASMYLGLFGGRRVLSPDGLPIWRPADMIEFDNGIKYGSKYLQPMVPSTWSAGQNTQFYRMFNQEIDPLKALGYLEGGEYPKNPFLNEPMGNIVWSGNVQNIWEPGAHVVPSSGDFVYFTPTSLLGSRPNPPGYKPAVVSYLGKYKDAAGLDQYLPGEYWVDVAENYVLFAYGRLPRYGSTWHAYDNDASLNGNPIPSTVKSRDWDGSGKEDPYERGILMYYSNTKRSKGQLDDKTSGGTVEF